MTFWIKVFTSIGLVGAVVIGFGCYGGILARYGVVENDIFAILAALWLGVVTPIVLSVTALDTFKCWIRSR